MWRVIGIDEDGTEHDWCYCETEEEAETKKEAAISAHERMVATYTEAIEMDKKIVDTKERRLQLGHWKTMGFFVKRFEVVRSD